MATKSSTTTKSYAEMTEEEKREWRKQLKKQQIQHMKSVGKQPAKVTKETAKPVTRDATKHAKTETEKKQDAEDEKRLMAGRTDKSLYVNNQGENITPSAKAVSRSAREETEKETLSNYDIKGAQAAKQSIESEIANKEKELEETTKAANADRNKRTFTINGKKVTVSSYKDPNNYKKTEEEKQVQSEISALTREKILAERAINQAEFMQEAAKDKDFDKYAAIGAKKAEELESVDPTVKTINGKQVKAYKQSATYKTKDDRKDYMTDDEKSTYNYFLGKYGEDKADEYLDSITDNLNYRKAEKAQEGNDGNVFLAAMTGINSGVSRFGDNLRDSARMLYGDDKYIPTSAAQYQGSMAREELADVGFKLPKELGGASLGQVGYDIIENTANMLPSMAVSAFAGPTAGAITTGIGSAGGAYNEALGEGYTPEQARTYAILSGTSEAALGDLIGGIAATGGVTSDKLLSKLLPKIKGALKKTAVTAGAKMLSEGGEEYLQEILTPVFKNIAFMEDNEIDLITEDALYSAFIGAINAGILNLPKNISQYSDYKAVDSANKAAQITTDTNTAQQATGNANGTVNEDIANSTPQTQNAQNQAKTAPQTTVEARTEQLYREGKSSTEIGETIKAEYYPNAPLEEVIQATDNFIRQSDFDNQNSTAQQLTFEERAEQLYREGKSWGEIGNILQAEYYPNANAEDIKKQARNYIRQSDFYGQKGVTTPTVDEQTAALQNQLIADPTARNPINQNITQQSVNTNANANAINANNTNNAVNGGDIAKITQYLQENVPDGNVVDYLSNIGNFVKFVDYLQSNMDSGVSSASGNAQNVQNVVTSTPNNGNLSNLNGNAQNINANTNSNIDETVYVNEDNAPLQSEPYYEQDGTEHPNTVGAKKNTNEFFSSLDKYGARPLRPEQVARDNYFETPKKLSDNVAMSEHIGYLAGSELGTDAFMDDVILNPLKYSHEINTDSGSIARAAQDIKNNGLTSEYENWNEKIKKDKRIRKDDLTKANIMALYYQNLAATDPDANNRAVYRQRAIALEQESTLVLTESGQNVQGSQIVQKLGEIEDAPSYVTSDNLFATKNLVDTLNERNKIEGKKKAKEIVLDQTLVDEAVRAEGTKEAVAKWDAVYKDIANQTGTSVWEKIRNYKYYCMLSNPQTHIRNILANDIMFVVADVKDVAKIGVEKAFNKALESKSKKAAKIDSKLEQLMAVDGADGKKISKLQEKSDRLHQFDGVQSKTAAIPKLNQIQFAWNDFDSVKDNYANSGNKWTGTNTNEIISKYKTNANGTKFEYYLSKKIEGNNAVSKGVKTILEHGTFGSLIDFDNWMLSDVEDGSAKKMNYTAALSERMAANGITAETANLAQNADIMAEIRADAMVEAFYNTFNQDNKVDTAIKKLAKTNPAVGAFVQSMFPFTKVPLNIVSTSVDYSPAGLVKGFIEMSDILRNSPQGRDVKKAVNDVAKGLTGTTLMGLGVFLRSIGKITNGLSDDDDEASFQRLTGEQAYAIKFDDGSTYTIDWIGAPIMAMFSGAQLYDILTGELGDKLTAYDELGDVDDWATLANWVTAGADSIINVGTSLLNPIMEMSMLSNVFDMFNKSYNNLGEIILDVVGNDMNKAVPQVLSSVTKFADNTKRNTYYVDKTDNIPDSIQKYVQTAQAKIPGLSSKLSAKVDAWGRTQKHSDRESTVGRFFDAFISPGKYSTNKTTKEDEMLAQLVAKTGDSAVYPDEFNAKTIRVDGEDFNLTAKEFEQIRKEKGQEQYDLVKSIMGDRTFTSLTSEQQAKAIKEIYSYSTATAKDGVHGYELDTADEKVNLAANEGLAKAKYFAVKAAKEDGNEKSIITIGRINDTVSLSNNEKLLAMKYLADLDIDKYTRFTNDPEEVETIYGVISDTSSDKEADIQYLIKDGYSAAEALAKYNAAKGEKKYKDGEFKFGNSTNQVAKATKLKAKGYDGETIALAACAVTSLGKYGTTKNYNTYIKMLEAVGITDKKFQKDFWNIYM